MYAKFEKAEKTRRASRWQVAEIISWEKDKLVEVHLLASKTMAEKMAEMEETNTEVIQVTRRKIADME